MTKILLFRQRFFAFSKKFQIVGREFYCSLAVDLSSVKKFRLRTEKFHVNGVSMTGVKTFLRKKVASRSGF